MLRMAIIACMVASLGACTTMEGPSPAQVSQSDDNQCQSYGLKPGATAYANCRIEIDQGRQNRRAAVAAAIISRPPLPTYQPSAMYSAPRTPVTCNSMRTGNMISTSCE